MPWNNNIKYALLAITLAALAQVATAQQAPASTYATAQDTTKVMDVRERLVQLALQNPNYEVADRKIDIARYQLKKSKGSWLNSLSAAGNLNEFTINPPATGAGAQANLFPRYNVGVSIPFDMFSSHSNDVKISRENLAIAQAEKNQRFREIKADVLTKYEDYLMHKQKLEFQSQITQDAQSVYLQAEKDFGEGIIKQEDYNKAYKAYTDELSKKAEMQRNLNVIKIDLEKIIGVSIDEVLQAK
jgi:outer membrane protein TolC